MYPLARDPMTDCCYTIITTTPFSMRKEGKRLRECKYYALMLYGVFVLLLLGPAGIANGVM